jgi:hypothetical protein
VGVERVDGAIAWYDGEGRALATIDSVPLLDVLGTLDPRGRLGYTFVMFARRLSMATGPGEIAYGFGGEFEIERRYADGGRHRVVRIAGRERPVTRREIDRVRDYLIAHDASFAARFPGAGPLRNDRQRAEAANQRLSSEILPRTMPAFAQLEIDPENNLWVREFDFRDAVDSYAHQPFSPPLDYQEPRRWTVLDREGHLLGDVAMPPAVDIHQIGSDWVLGVWRDHTDVEHVRMYRLHKPVNPTDPSGTAQRGGAAPGPSSGR